MSQASNASWTLLPALRAAHMVCIRLYPAIHHLPVGFALVREGGVVPVAYTRRMSTCVAIARVPWVSGRNGRRSLSLYIASKKCRGNSATRVRIPLGIFYRISLRARGEKIDWLYSKRRSSSRVRGLQL